MLPTQSKISSPCSSTLSQAGEFKVEIPPGTRVVESSSPFALIDVPAPLQAAWTAGKAGLAGAAAVAGWLQKRQGRHGERTDHEPDG